MRPDDVLNAVRDDARQIADLSAWCFHDGFWPKGPAPDRVAGVNQQDVFGRDEFGPNMTDEEMCEPFRFDIGVGDHRSRTAFQATAWLVTFLDLRLAASLQALGQVSPKFAVVLPQSSLRVRDEALNLSALRIEAILAVWNSADRHQQKAARTQLADPRISPPSARSAADQAVRILSRALSRGSTQGEATAEAMCAVCLIRVVGEKTGPRCPTCAQWKWRNKAERPRSLDVDELASPYAAAARRRARGEGYGDS